MGHFRKSTRAPSSRIKLLTQKKNHLMKKEVRVAQVVQRFSATFGLGCDPGDPRLSPVSGSLHEGCFSLCLCLCLSLCVS